MEKPTQIFRNAIDTNFFVQPSLENKKALKKKYGLEDFSAVYVGRLSYEKSVDKVLEAFSIVHKEIRSASWRTADQKISLLIGGDGPARQCLEELSEKLNIQNKIKFLGFVRGQEWLEVFQSADMFMTASKSENMPLTIIEAMSAGLPVVAVGEKGVVEIVENGESGFLSKADDVRDMARNILKLQRDKNLREAMGSKARNLALKYSYEEIGKNLANVYSEVVNGLINSPQTK